MALFKLINFTGVLDTIGYQAFFHPLLIFIEDWRCDQCRWVNGGVAKLPRSAPRLRKVYFDVDLPNGPSKEFQKHAYQLLGKE